MKRTAFFISDGTGLTSEALGHSLLAQFDSIEFEQITLPYVNTLEKAHEAVSRINQISERDQERALIFDTIVNEDIRAIIAESNAFKIDVFSSFLKPLESELSAHSNYSVGKSHGIVERNRYKERIDSVNFAIDNDDGARTKQYQKADIILVGVSRCGKTPTCLYMAMQFGIRAANYPLTEEDMEFNKLPSVLEEHKHKLYGLTIDPFQLSAIRNERRPNSRYASLDQCDFEVREVEKLLKKLSIPSINTTNFSIEEISTRIMDHAGLDRRMS